MVSTMTNSETVTIPEGYKQTEVGVIPEDWEVHEFGELVNYIKGYPFKSPEYSNDGIRVIRVSDTTRDSIEDKNAVFVSSNASTKYKKWKLRESDLIFTTVGSKPPMYDSLVGKAIYVSASYDGSLLNQNAVLIRSKNGASYFQRLLLGHFRTERYIDHIELIFRGNANQASITLGNLFEFKLPIPSDIKEQTAIANALSDVDNLIASLETLIAKKSAIKTAAMQQLLTGKKRLPAFEGKSVGELLKVSEQCDAKPSEKHSAKPNSACDTPSNHHADTANTHHQQTAPRPGYKHSELGEIPEDWEVMSIGQAFKITAGGDLRVEEYSDIKTSEAPYPIFSNAIQKKGLYGYCRSFDYDGEFITITARGGLGHAEYRNEKFCSIGRLLALSPSKSIDCKFISNYINQYLNFASESSGVPQLTAPQASQYKLLIPSIEEQTAIANVLSDMDAELDALQQRFSKTQKIKQGMMQELLTGKTRFINCKEVKV